METKQDEEKMGPEDELRSVPVFLSTFAVGEMCAMDEGATFGPYTTTTDN